MFPARAPHSPAIDPATALPFDDNAFESRIAWIFGSPRTGSTWLLRMLVHPLTPANKPSGVKRRRRTLKGPSSEIVVPVNESHLPLHLTPLRQINFETEEQLDPNTYLVNSRHTERSSYFFSEAHSETAWPWIRCMTLARFYVQAELALEDHGAEDCVVAVKEPNGSHGAQRIMSLLPRSKLIFLMRDGRDVVDSSLALRLPGGGRADRGGVRDQSEDRLRYVTRGSRLWLNRMNAVQRAYDQHDPELRLMVRYENLKSEPVAELGRIFEFLGLSRTPQEVEAAVEAETFENKQPDPEANEASSTARRRASTGEWRNSLRQDEQRVAEDIMGEKLVELGYR